VRLSLPQKIGNLVQRAAHAQTHVAGHGVPAHLRKERGSAFLMQKGSAAAIGLAGFSAQAPLQPRR